VAARSCVTSPLAVAPTAACAARPACGHVAWAGAAASSAHPCACRAFGCAYSAGSADVRCARTACACPNGCKGGRHAQAPAPLRPC
jgi:hypothetical protein